MTFDEACKAASERARTIGFAVVVQRSFDGRYYVTDNHPGTWTVKSTFIGADGAHLSPEEAYSLRDKMGT